MNPRLIDGKRRASGLRQAVARLSGRHAIVLGRSNIVGKPVLVGDVDFEVAREVAGAITPVPGSVEPMTFACPLRNPVIASCAQHRLHLPAWL